MIADGLGAYNNDCFSLTHPLQIRKKSVVLDICTGLGYSAIAAMRAGAAQVGDSKKLIPNLHYAHRKLSLQGDNLNRTPLSVPAKELPPPWW